MLMSDSMGGNAKTLMFVCCSPADYNCAETCNALDFAKRCKDITNNVGGGSKKELGQVKALKAELLRLKRERGDDLNKQRGIARRPGRKY
jgi:kinesin family protein 5